MDNSAFAKMYKTTRTTLWNALNNAKTKEEIRIRACVIDFCNHELRKVDHTLQYLKKLNPAPDNMPVYV